MYNTIFIPLDVSKREQRILANIERLQQRCDAIIILLRVVGLEAGHGHYNVDGHVQLMKAYEDG